ncbi:MAG: hypothetical protein DRN33_02580 [Thermoplasmata archaeon]|nr:MAG: hypothetical protein DRN33_02580 [Thermoplasmata archaeon]
MMSESKKPLKLLRGVAVALMSLTVFFTLVGGAGTTCAAFGAEKFESMAALVPYKWLYQVLVVLSLAAGIWGIPVTVALVRGGRHAYRDALLVLLAGAVTSGIQMTASQLLRGDSAPANVRFYITAFTLVVFLLLRLPSIRDRLDFSQPFRGGKSSAGGAALVLCGILALTPSVWAGPTHPQAWIDVLRMPLMLGGGASLLGGVGLWLSEFLLSRNAQQRTSTVQNTI